jgi:hypothetical protein
VIKNGHYKEHPDNIKFLGQILYYLTPNDTVINFIFMSFMSVYQLVSRVEEEQSIKTTLLQCLVAYMTCFSFSQKLSSGTTKVLVE